MDDNIPTIAGIYGGKRARDQIPKIDHTKIKKICCIGAGYVVSTFRVSEKGSLEVEADFGFREVQRVQSLQTRIQMLPSLSWISV